MSAEAKRKIFIENRPAVKGIEGLFEEVTTFLNAMGPGKIIAVNKYWGTMIAPAMYEIWYWEEQ